MLMTRLKIAAAAALASPLWHRVGWSRRRRAGRRTRRTPTGTSGDRGPRRSQRVAAPPEAEPGAMVEVRGRVVGPDGKPVAGATLRTAYLDTDDPAPRGDERARTAGSSCGSRDRSAIDAMLNGYDDIPLGGRHGPGFGPGWARGVFKAAASGELTVRLVEDGPPIEGRIVDLEGRPVAGAQVKVERSLVRRRTAVCRHRRPGSPGRRSRTAGSGARGTASTSCR